MRAHLTRLINLIRQNKENVILMFVSVGVGLFISEIAARYVHQAWPFEQEWTLAPHLTAKDATLRWRYSQGDSRNSLGLNNREIEEKNGQFRILFLGDSLIFNARTTSDMLVTETIEQNLNQAGVKSTQDIEVVNAGVPGYTTYQEYEFLKLYGLDMTPDMVILGFVFNDTFYKYLHIPLKGGALGADPEVALNYFDKSSFPGFLFPKSYLAHQVSYLSQRAIEQFDGRQNFRFARRKDFFLSWKDYGWGPVDRLLTSMRDQLDSLDIMFLVVIFPMSAQVDSRNLATDEAFVLYRQSRIREICDRLGVPCLDLTDSMIEGGGPPLFDDYLHLGNRGNDISSREITSFLVENLDPQGGSLQDR